MKPRVLVLGATGMLGHKVYQVFSEACEVYATVRKFDERLKALNLFDESRVLSGIDVSEMSGLSDCMAKIQPDVVINCIGVIKQLEAAHDMPRLIFTNALFPHLLNDLCARNSAKLIHLSTDCVFSGKDGNYAEDAVADATDAYGRTKWLGEVTGSGALTLRTSMIGHELFSKVSLLDWFLSQRGKPVNGFTHAVFSGMPTIILSRELLRIVRDHRDLSGLYHLSVAPISKFDLLQRVAKVYGLDCTIVPREEPHIDRGLNSQKYQGMTTFNPPSWDSMIREMHSDFAHYTDQKVYR
jgi:dTDP-4-dehydrorhamnose reductase